jgi:hypothetical protein
LLDNFLLHKSRFLARGFTDNQRRNIIAPPTRLSFDLVALLQSRLCLRLKRAIQASFEAGNKFNDDSSEASNPPAESAC